MFDTKYGLEQAVLAGTKTMTRRIIPTSETEGGIVPVSFWNGKWCGAHGKPLKRQPYKVGEVLAVAERYTDIVWRTNPFIEKIPDLSANGELYHSKGWKNKMFVRADLMPHRIRITNVRVERIQDISDEDCLREGVWKLKGEPSFYTFDNWMFKNKIFRCEDSPREVFAALIDKISGKGTWDKNPWVFVYEFHRMK